MDKDKMCDNLEKTLSNFINRLKTLELKLREDDREEYVDYKIKKLDEFSEIELNDYVTYISRAIETYRDLIHYLLLKTQLYEY